MSTGFKEIKTGIVATIGRKFNKPAETGTVKWNWKNDKGVIHAESLDKVLYFPQSPINIMSVTEFSKQFNDEEGTGIDTKMKKSRFY